MPSALTGNSFVHLKHITAEDKVVKQQVRLSQAEDAAACKNELHLGFSKEWSSAAAAHSMTGAVAPGGWQDKHKSAFQAEHEVAINIITDVAKELGRGVVSTPSASTSVEPGSATTSPGLESPVMGGLSGSSEAGSAPSTGSNDDQGKGKKAKIDVAIKRTELYSRALRECEAREADLLRIITEASWV